MKIKEMLTGAAIIRLSGIGLGLFCLALSARADAPTNIVQNGSFTTGLDDWTGDILGTAGSPSIPGGRCGVLETAYQALPTTIGQYYTVSFDAAADLLWGSTVAIGFDLNNVSAATYETIPHTYNNQVNRYGQMQWQTFDYTFLASATTTTIGFLDLTASTYDFGLTDVSMVSVPSPEPSGYALLGLGGAIALARRGKKAEPGSEPV